VLLARDDNSFASRAGKIKIVEFFLPGRLGHTPSPYSAPSIISFFCGDLSMSTTVQAEASKPQRKMQECNRCKAAGFPNQPITFEKVGEDLATGKVKWKLVDEYGNEHVHKGGTQLAITAARRKRIVDIATVADVSEARKLLALGWEYKTSYPATLANVPHYVLVKRE
jgi:hypothetical protein